MDKLDKLIEVKLQELFEQWGANPFPSSGDGWNNGAYAPSIPIKDRRDIDDEEDDKDKSLQEHIAKNKKKGFSDNIEDDTKENENFRKVLYTGENTQLVLMSLNPGEDIGSEVHDVVDQFFRIESGNGKAIVNDHEYKINDGSSVVVPAGAEHNFINTGKDKLKLYSLYSPPHHKDGTIHKTKADAIQDKEHFDGKTTED